MTPKPVARDLIESVILDAAQAPPPFRDQNPLAFNVVQGVARIAAYGKRVMDYTREHRPDGPGWDWLDRPGFKIFWDAPVVVITSGPQVRDSQPRRPEPDAVGACTRIGNVLGWFTDALASAHPKCARSCSIPSALTPVAVLCLGYPAAIPEAVIRERAASSCGATKPELATTHFFFREVAGISTPRRPAAPAATNGSVNLSASWSPLQISGRLAGKPMQGWSRHDP